MGDAVFSSERGLRLLGVREFEREAVTERFVRGLWHWFSGDESAADAWMRAATYWLPAPS